MVMKMGCYYEKCFVIGTGQFAFNCANYLQDKYQVDCIYEYGNYLQSRLEILCKKNNIAYVKLIDKSACDAVMREIKKSNNRTLIISASNIYIFPPFIVEDDKVDIINYHPGLFARHLGRNAECWAVYEQDQIAGVTWHVVSSEIDHGLILAEKTIELNNNFTSVKLMMRQYQVGFLLFKEMMEQILQNEEVQKKKEVHYGKMHYSSEKPNNGILDLTWQKNKISAFLRSMDYGSLNVMGKPIVIEDNTKYGWDSYKILDDNFRDGIFLNSKIIKKEDTVFVLQNYHKLNDIRK